MSLQYLLPATSKHLPVGKEKISKGPECIFREYKKGNISTTGYIKLLFSDILICKNINTNVHRNSVLPKISLLG
jgi:hypothetical protein